jgi:hypothetical protein
MSSARPEEVKHHRMIFEDRTEGAAFVAALSRFLSSPAGSPYLTRSDVVEVRSHPSPGDGLELYLSDSAWDAARAAFSPLPVSEALPSAALPEACTLIIHGTVSPWGISEAQKNI